MSFTNREGISIVLRLFKQINADARLTYKAAYSLLMKHSKWLIKRDSDVLKLLRKHKIYQKVKCLEVIEAPMIDPCCGIRSLKCSIYRTKTKLPELYEDSAGIIIHNITSIDGSTDIKLVTASAIKRKLNNPWKGKKDGVILAFYNDGYLYFPNKHLKMIEVEGLFTKSIDEKENCTPCKECDKEPCVKFLDKDFIIPDYLEAQLFDAVIRDLSNTYSRIPEREQEVDKNDTKG